MREPARTPTAAPHAALDAEALACPECGSALRLQLTASEPGYAGGRSRVRPLRPAPGRDPISNFDASIREFKRTLVGRALAENGGVMKRAAKALGIKYTTFVAMAHRLGVLDEKEPETGD